MSVLNVPRLLGYQSALSSYTYNKIPMSNKKEWFHAIKVFFLNSNNPAKGNQPE
jgi:hypothetical protein